MSTSEKDLREAQFEGEVVAAMPLALLESVRAHDLPGEVLEDEDLTLSLPRRFGLSDVARAQIMRYEAAQRAGRSVRVDEVMALVRLVLRRPDAEMIMRETGVRLAERHYSRVSGPVRKLYQRLPRRVAMVPIARAVRRLFRDYRAGNGVHVHRQPFSITVDRCNTARLNDEGTACAMFTASLEKLAELYTGRRWRADHVHCGARGESRCEWQAAEVSEG